MFGTDGIRGLINKPPMTAEIALRVGMAVGIYLNTNHRKKVIIAKDTRLSGYLLESALTAGLVAVGVDVVLVGPMPTPAVPMLIKSLRADFGIMITASHNPYYDNGLKLFSQNGHKITDQCQNIMENMIIHNNFNKHLARIEDLGKTTRLEDAAGRYIEYLKRVLPEELSLTGFRIALDCANGAAYRIGPTVLWELGAEVINIANKPNGLNINKNCGSMHPQLLSKAVLEHQADIGIALDGDADRVLICDDKGKILNGDHLIAAIALHMSQHTGVRGNRSIVVTDLSNTALDIYLAQHNIKVFRSVVGDRYVKSKMCETSSYLGGEVSGHILSTKHCNTGDGLMASLCFLATIVKQKKRSSDFQQLFPLMPQLTSSIPFIDTNPLEDDVIEKKLNQLKNKYSTYRIIIRNSGTERLIRVMIEGSTREMLQDILTQITDVINAVRE